MDKRGVSNRRGVLGVLSALFLAYTTIPAQVTAPIQLVLQAENCSERQGGVYDPPQDHDPRYTINELGAGDWLRFESVNFYDGEFGTVTISYHAAYYVSGTVRLRLDSPTGTILGTLADIPQTPSQINDPPSQHSGSLSAGASGIHDLYVTFEGTQTFCDLDYVKLSGEITVDPADAKIYYVAADGDDLNSGESVDSPFQTIQKAASLMIPGSKCYIRGGVYRETVIPQYTGIAGAPLAFEAYQGETVYISGADSVKNWTSHSGSIYRAQLGWSLGRYDNQVFVDGNMAWAARSPNVDDDYLPHEWLNWCGNSIGVYNWKAYQDTVEPIALPSSVCLGGSSTGSGTFTMSVSDADAPNQLPSTLFTPTSDFFAGGLIANRNWWWQSVGYITGSSASGSNLTVDGRRTGSMWTDQGGNGWVSHAIGALDSPNEFHFDSASGALYLWAPGGGNPSARLVEAKRRILGFDLSAKSYVTLKGLRFHAASVTMADANNCTIDDCHFKYLSHYNIYNWPYVGAGFFNSPFDPSDGRTGIYVGGHDNVVQNTSINVSAGSGIILDGSYNTVENCRIRACNYTVTYQAGILVMRRIILDPNGGRRNRITRNTIDFSGRANIQVAQNYSPSTENDPDRLIIANNNLGVSCYTSKETGAIAGQAGARVEVVNNIFHSIGGLEAFGIVMEYDFNGRHWIVHHNLFYQGNPIIPWRTGGNYTFDWNDTEAKCFNNTLVDICEELHRDREVGWPGYFKNNLYAESDTVPWRFSDPVRRDYTLRPSSPAVDAGEVIPGYVEAGDFNGTAPDVGAFEHGQPAWTAGSSVGLPEWTYPSSSSPAGPIRRPHSASMRAPALRVGPSCLIVTAPAMTGGNVSLFDASGRLAARARFSPRNVATLDTRGVAAGIYVVRVDLNGARFAWRVSLGN